VIYYVFHEDAPLFALTLYGKTEKSDLSGADRRAVAALARALELEYRR
jgi:hypothetical protein